MKKLFVLAFTCLSIITAAGCGNSDQSVGSMDTALQNEEADKCIGIYDSRCIAIAYYNSAMHGDYMKEVSRQHKAAKDAGDSETAKTLEQKMEKMQQQAHYQGFGTAPVEELLEKVAGGVDKLKNDQGLDLIVSKWNYSGDICKCVDITDELVMLYNPGPKALEWIRQAKAKEPIPQTELEKMDHIKD